MSSKFIKDENCEKEIPQLEEVKLDFNKNSSEDENNNKENNREDENLLLNLLLNLLILLSLNLSNPSNLPNPLNLIAIGEFQNLTSKNTTTKLVKKARKLKNLT